MERPRPTRRTLLVATCLCLAGLLPAAEAAAQEQYTFTTGLFGGLGGSLDAEPGDALDNTGFQANFGMVIQPGTHLVVRVGQLDLDKDGLFLDLATAELTYATIGGEYRYRHRFYDSGVYVALGGYRLEGNELSGSTRDETAAGLGVGITGEFPITRWLGVQLEVSGHYATFDDAQLFAMGHGGFVIHW